MIDSRRRSGAIVCGVLLAALLCACGGGGGQPAGATAASPPATPASRAKGLCTGAALTVDAAPGEAQTRGCLVTFVQNVADPEDRARLGAGTVNRRYVLYVPANLPDVAAPVVIVFPGYGASAETAAVHYTHGKFESLADQNGFVVVYGNGLPNPPEDGAGDAPQKEGGYLQGCFPAHSGEGIDVRYVREILAQLQSVMKVDRSRVYAAGLSAGGGMTFELALEAPDLVAAIAPAVPLPFQPGGEWRMRCNPAAGYGSVSIAMLAATADPYISYGRGPSKRYPDARYPGMEETRDAWLSALGITGPPTVETLPDRVPGDSYEPDSGMTSSTVERFTYPRGPAGQELVYYRAVGAGHWWPSPTQSFAALWPTFGKTNQDIDFAEQAWDLFRRHSRP
ncbi:MAG: PHB depolymerase family esterase [Vicinamibacteria bacterium]